MILSHKTTYIFLKTLSLCLRISPQWIRNLLSNILYMILYYLILIRKKEVLKNLNVAFHGKSSAWYKKTAKDSLENCHNKNKTLFNFIKDKKDLVESIMSSSGSKQVKDLCKEIYYDPAEDTDFAGFEQSLYKLYFTTFFSMMRKREKN